MKVIGITRRIDDLGRIVIPKEIRKTLRIREGDPMEIIVSDGNIILKKISDFTEKEFFAKALVKTLYDSYGLYTAICNRDTIIAAYYEDENLVGQQVSDDFVHLLDERREYLDGTIATSVNLTQKNGDYLVSYLVPLIHLDCQGAIAVLGNVKRVLPTDTITALRFAGSAMTAFLNAE